MSQYIPLRAIAEAPPVTARVAKVLSLLIVASVLAVASIVVFGDTDGASPTKPPTSQTAGGSAQTLHGHATQP
jgi:hypothetical protein